MNINWNLYRIFCCVATCGSTAAAAKKLMMAQPSISRAVKLMEDQFGYDLFIRSSSGMELTEQGQELFNCVNDAVCALEAAEAFMSSARATKQKTVRIAVIDTTLQFFLIRLVDAFHLQSPDVDFKYSFCRTVREAEALLDSGNVDFAVINEPSVRADLLSVPVKELSDILVCAERFLPELKQHAFTPASLADYPVVMHLKDSASRTLVDEYLAANGVVLQPVYEFSSSASIIRQIKHEFALAFVLENAAEDELASGQLVRLDITPPLPHRYYYLVRPKHIRNRYAREFVRFMMA